MTGARNPSRFDAARSFVAACLSLAFLWSLALSASPQLHGCFHADAGKAEHRCAATLIASGNCHHSAPAPLFTGPTPVVLSSTISTLTPLWMKSPFLEARVLEHAPPVCS